MSKIVFIDVDKEDQARVRDNFPDAEIVEGLLEPDALIEKCRDAEIISVFIRTPLPKEVIEKLPKLKLICTRSVGYDHIDLKAAADKGITVCNVPDYGSHVIAEHVFALILGTLRHIGEGDDRVESGEFDYHGLRGIALRGKSIGIIGTGKIGSRVAQIAHGFGMKISAFDLHPNAFLEDLFGVQYVQMDELFAKSDFVTLHVPALKATHHMINAEALKKMKDGVVLINTARGELIDSDALVEALKSGKVSYALLDVLEHEKNFEENKELIDHPNAVTTPHIAFFSDESMRNMYEDCFDSIEEHQAGRTPEHIVRIKN